MMKSVYLSSEIESRLSTISQKMGITESKLIEKAIIDYLENLEDLQDARERLSDLPNCYLSLEEVEKELGLVD
jgi:predicted DNA-binding protein